jgi:hypothetical protein
MVRFRRLTMALGAAGTDLAGALGEDDIADAVIAGTADQGVGFGSSQVLWCGSPVARQHAPSSRLRLPAVGDRGRARRWRTRSTRAAATSSDNAPIADTDRGSAYTQPMRADIDLAAAAAFMATHARVLDRRRFQLLTGEADPSAVLAALEAYRNPDGGYGWGLEADLRSPESQPGAALHAFEVFEELAPITSPHAVALCDWLASISLPDGGLPFALPIGNAAGCAPWWTQADPTVSSLQITAAVTAAAHRVATRDPAVAAHPWLPRATGYCLAAIRALGEAHALELSFAVRLLHAVYDTQPEAAALLERLGRHIPASGLLAVEGGAEGEAIRPLDVAPVPDRPVRALFAPETITAELRRLAAQQQDDGGWRVDFRPGLTRSGAGVARLHDRVRAVHPPAPRPGLRRANAAAARTARCQPQRRRVDGDIR